MINNINELLSLIVITMHCDQQSVIYYCHKDVLYPQLCGVERTLYWVAMSTFSYFRT